MMRICMVLGLMLATASCSSSRGGEAKDDGHKSGGPGKVIDYAWGGLTIEFSPMYSAFIDGDHPCAIPAAVTDQTPQVKWAAADNSMVELEPTPAGVTITTKRAGTVDVIAYTDSGSGDLAGRSTLTITPFTAAEWEAGNARYHNGVVFDPASVNVIVDYQAGDGGTRPTPNPIAGLFGTTDDTACDSCHGEDAPNLPTEITPQQIGKYSDDELGQIIRSGQRPDRPGMFLFPLFEFLAFHTFDATDPHYQMTHNSIIAYLRSLAPEAQIERDAGSTANP
jgi:hypothetical protein